jgi:hypothetical protein
MIATDTIEHLLAKLPIEERDQPVALLRASSLVEKLTGQRPHKSALHRWASRPSNPLPTLKVGSVRLVTARQLATWFVSCGETKAPKAKARKVRA